VDPNILASYSTWLVGQYTTIAGYERVRQGRVHFAGEHCSVANQGFMEGGAESGAAAAREILADYGVRMRAAV
jgi:monoamine oxidase